MSGKGRGTKEAEGGGGSRGSGFLSIDELLKPTNHEIEEDAGTSGSTETSAGGAEAAPSSVLSPGAKCSAVVGGTVLSEDPHHKFPTTPKHVVELHACFDNNFDGNPLCEAHNIDNGDDKYVTERAKRNFSLTTSQWTLWKDSLPPYLDNNSSTPLDPRALKAMMPYLEGFFGNPGSAHVRGLINKAALEEARQRVARCLGCAPQCIYFTSGATECLNWVLKSVTEKRLKAQKKCHIVTTQIEHPAVLEICKAFVGADEGQMIRTRSGVRIGEEYVAESESRLDEAVGTSFTMVTTARDHSSITVSFCPVDAEGIIDLHALTRLLSEETTLVSIPHANGEIGAVQPIAAAAKLIRTHAPAALLHVDCSQSLGKTEVSAELLNADFITSKAVVRQWVISRCYFVALDSTHGTENVPYCVALGSACEAIASESQMGREGNSSTSLKGDLTVEKISSIENMRETLCVFIETLFSALGARTGWEPCELDRFLRVNGPLRRHVPPMKSLEDFRKSLPNIWQDRRVLPNTLSLSVHGASASRITSDLKAELCISAGATCHSSDRKSDTLAAINLPGEWAQGTIRVSAEAKKGGDVLAVYFESSGLVPMKKTFSKISPLSESK